MFGPSVWDEIAGKVVIDFGCGAGADAIELAQRGAKKVIGIDIRVRALETARRAADEAGVAGRCSFTAWVTEKADVIFSVDGFEHYPDPRGVLEAMKGLLKPHGRILITFGPPWFHPLGGHLFSAFPWAHLVFTERALIRWRSDFESDGATRFCDVEGGLNGMTVRRFRQLVQESGYAIESFEAVPIRKLRFIATPWTREFTTAAVRCRLVQAAIPSNPIQQDQHGHADARSFIVRKP